MSIDDLAEVVDARIDVWIECIEVVGCHAPRQTVLNRPAFAGGRLVESGCHGWMLQHGVVALLSFGRGYVADGLQEPPVVEPVHPFQRRELDGFEGPPRATSMDDLSFVETIDRLGESIVVTVADAADRRLNAGFRQALGVLNRDVLAASIAVVHEPAAMDGRRSWRACSSASSTKPVCAERDTRQPTMRRA